LPQVQVPAYGVAMEVSCWGRASFDHGTDDGPAQAVTKATATRYRSASRAGKATILDELCVDRGLAHAARRGRLPGPGTGPLPQPQPRQGTQSGHSPTQPTRLQRHPQPHLACRLSRGRLPRSVIRHFRGNKGALA